MGGLIVTLTTTRASGCVDQGRTFWPPCLAHKPCRLFCAIFPPYECQSRSIAQEAVFHTYRMAPNLALSQHELVQGMIESGCTNAEIADVAGCSTRSIRTIRTNLRCFVATRAPPNTAGRPRSIAMPMLRALRNQLTETPDIYQDEMVAFLIDGPGRRYVALRNSETPTRETFASTRYTAFAPIYVDESSYDKRAAPQRLCSNRLLIHENI